MDSNSSLPLRSPRSPSCATVMGSSVRPQGSSFAGFSGVCFFSDKHHLLRDILLLYLYHRKDGI